MYVKGKIPRIIGREQELLKKGVDKPDLSDNIILRLPLLPSVILDNTYTLKIHCKTNCG